ncbi:hypothetical protein AB0H37_44855 [Actinomadura sp. NPDC023710]|uniref:hypothetical protein n=1 Tax=Actinomadura sp. NPDC023710 TaxID=3158219 RepID=UPI0033F54BF0
MGVYTPAGKDLSAAVWATLDAAGLKGLDVAEAAQWPDTFDGGFRLSGRGDQVEVFHSLDAEYARAHPDARHDRITAVMFSTIADILLAAGFGFTAQPDDRITDTNRHSPVLLVHSHTPAHS